MAYRRYQSGFNLGIIEYLIITNLILFIAVSINPRLIDLFGLEPALLLKQPWTILTAMFVHSPFSVNIWHILGNMLTLYFFGGYLLQLLGDKKFLLVYFIGGLLGNILYTLLALNYILTSPFSIVIGASGAIFAVGGALAVMRPNLKVYIIPIPVPIPLWVAVVGGFLIISPGIAWQAHLGGLVFGAAIGYYYRRTGRYYY